MKIVSLFGGNVDVSQSIVDELSPSRGLSSSPGPDLIKLSRDFQERNEKN